jgi:hypothetical protein
MQKQNQIYIICTIVLKYQCGILIKQTINTPRVYENILNFIINISS